MTKPGIATTEFWVHNILQVASIVLASLGTIKPTLAAECSALLGVVYIVCRSVVKFADAGNEALGVTDGTAGNDSTTAAPPAPPMSTTASTPVIVNPGVLGKLPVSGSIGGLRMGLLLGLSALGFMADATGCQSSPTTVADNSTRSLILAINTAYTLIATHAVTGSAARNLVAAIVVAETAQHSWNQAVIAGDANAISVAQTAAVAALAQVQTQIAAAQGGGQASPASQPATGP